MPMVDEQASIDEHHVLGTWRWAACCGDIYACLSLPYDTCVLRSSRILVLTEKIFLLF